MQSPLITAQIRPTSRWSAARLAGRLLAAFVLALALSSLVGGLASVGAQTPPASYYGTAAPNDRIEARFNGTLCAEAVAGVDGFWSLRVSTGGTCGISEGGTLAFFRNGTDSGARETFRVAGVPASITNGVNVGSGPLKPVPPALGDASFLGVTPPPGGAALLVNLRPATPDQVRLALTAVGCRLQMMAITVDNGWLIYIDGAPAIVNASFPSQLGENTPFYVRC
jgi:hypothetical protein